MGFTFTETRCGSTDANSTQLVERDRDKRFFTQLNKRERNNSTNQCNTTELERG